MYSSCSNLCGSAELSCASMHVYDSDTEHRSCSHCFAIVKTELNTDAVVAELKTNAAAEPNTDAVEAELRTDAIESSTDETEEEGCTKEKAASRRRLHQGEGCTVRVNLGVVDMVVVVIPSSRCVVETDLGAAGLYIVIGAADFGISSLRSILAL